MYGYLAAVVCSLFAIPFSLFPPPVVGESFFPFLSFPPMHHNLQLYSNYTACAAGHTHRWQWGGTDAKPRWQQQQRPALATGVEEEKQAHCKHAVRNMFLRWMASAGWFQFRNCAMPKEATLLVRINPVTFLFVSRHASWLNNPLPRSQRCVTACTKPETATIGKSGKHCCSGEAEEEVDEANKKEDEEDSIEAVNKLESYNHCARRQFNKNRLRALLFFVICTGSVREVLVVKHR